MSKRQKGSDQISGAMPQMAGDTSMGNPERERIAQRAYELYLARGGTDGRAMDDWLSAERELIEGNEDQSES